VYAFYKTTTTTTAAAAAAAAAATATATASLTFNNSTFCPHSVFMFCVDLRTNSDYFPIQH
jgi:hypothetical protein